MNRLTSSVFLIYLINLSAAALHVNLCCSKASGNCREACQEITGRLLANEEEFSRSDLTSRLLDYCSNNNVPLWRCINQTDTQDENEIKWAGRVCCHLAETEPCHQACKHADRLDDITPKCRMSDEVTLYECVEKKQKGEACCDMARNSRCHSVCRKSLVSRRVTRQHMDTACAGNVQNCMANLNSQNTYIISQKLGHCCDSTTDVYCRERCKILVNNKQSDVSIYQDLTQNNCGMVSFSSNPPNVQDMWMCMISNPELQQALSSLYPSSTGAFPGSNGYPGGYPGGSNLFPGGMDAGSIGMLNPGGQVPDPWRPNRRPTLRITTPRPNNNIQEVGMDVTKAYCCSKGTTPRCRKLCHAAFSTEWQTQWKDFEMQCLRSSDQQQLIQCLEDVNESCELGCDGMSFCTAFNYRSTELFRGCNKLNDEAAAKEYERWTMTSVIEIPHLNADYKLYIKNISQCAPQVWKAIACTLLIKPCTKQTHSNRICRANCIKMLNTCLDWERMAGVSHPSEICNILSPHDNDNCINLDNYMEDKKPPPVRTTTGKIIKIHGKTLTHRYDMSMRASPCKNNTCNPMQVCMLNRACAGDNHCPDYTCPTGCKLGEISPHMVPSGTYAKILTNAPVSDKVCSKICQCSATGMFNNCHPQYCINLDYCKQGDKMIEHGTVLNGSCPKCVCHGGELVCNKHQCKSKSSAVAAVVTSDDEQEGGNSKFTGMPCNCSLHYIPVCGWNGVTFPNDCFAKCNGVQEGEYRPGPCSSLNPCDSSPCSTNEQCVWTPKVCMYSLGKDCPQFECVRREERCNYGNGDTTNKVCANSDTNYDSLCDLVRHKDKLRYKGRCLGSCDEDFEVCGKDGNTYSSECTAHAHKIMKDYSGSCRALGVPGQKPRCDKSVGCAKLVREKCTGYIPPGACCPYCGSALRILFSVREIDKAMQSLGMRARDVFTTHNIISSLERHVQVKNCRLFGHISIEGDLIVMVVPTKETKVTREIDLCHQEAEKIKVMINSRNPRLLSEVALSPLLYARSVHHTVSSSSISVLSSTLLLLTLVFNYLR